MRSVTVRAPARVDLAGGSLDLWPLGMMVKDALTVNVAIGLRAAARVESLAGDPVELVSRDLDVAYGWRAGAEQGGLPLLERLCEAAGALSGFRLETWSEVPPGSGLGGSSALSAAVATALGTWRGTPLGDAETVARCRDVEAANLRIPTGVQDFWPAMRGGVLAVHYEPGGERVERLSVPLEALAERLVVVYTGRSRLSADTNWSLVKRFIDGERDAVSRLEGIARVAGILRRCLVEGNLDDVGPLLSEEWSHRAGLADGVATPEMEALLHAGMAAGASGGKGCGAGGGGCLALWVPPGARCQVEDALRAAGGTILPAKPSAEGRTVEVEP